MKNADEAIMGEKFVFDKGGAQFPVFREWVGVLLLTSRQKIGLLLHQKQISPPSWTHGHFSLFLKMLLFVKYTYNTLQL